MNEGVFVIEKGNDFFGNKDRKIEIPNHIVHICQDAFCENKRLNKLVIHNKLKKIGNSAFEGCVNLKKVKFLGESELVVIPEKCFKDCTSLENFIIPPEVGVIKKYAFSGCTNISHIVVPETVIAIEAGAFDKWGPTQTIEIYSNFRFGLVCKAKIINHSLTDDELSDIEETYEYENGMYMYGVLAKCGHVGRHRYMPIEFPILAETKKEAAKLARSFPRVKHDHKDAILKVRQLNLNEYNELRNKNNENPYLKIKSSYQQKNIKVYIDEHSLPETENNL